jgi:hypothetical protein
VVHREKKVGNHWYRVRNNNLVFSKNFYSEKESFLIKFYTWFTIKWHSWKYLEVEKLIDFWNIKLNQYKSFYVSCERVTNSKNVSLL